MLASTEAPPTQELEVVEEEIGAIDGNGEQVGSSPQML